MSEGPLGLRWSVPSVPSNKRVSGLGLGLGLGLGGKGKGKCERTSRV